MRREYGYLTESGIDFGDGDILMDEKVIAIALEAKKVFEEGNHEKFEEFIGPYIRRESGDLNDEQLHALIDTAICESTNFTISNIMIYHDTSGED